MLGAIANLLLGVWARLTDRTIAWPKLTFLMALAAIVGHRVNLRRHNLIDTETDSSVLDPASHSPTGSGLPQNFDTHGYRMPDGSNNDLEKPWMGMAEARFGRNVPLSAGYPERADQLMQPSPRVISNALMARKEFIPVPYLNVLAAAWIQFMVHDWLGHGANDASKELEIPLDDNDTWPPDRENDAANGPMRVRATRPDVHQNEHDSARPPTFRNSETHWWDGSQLYGSSWQRMELLRREGGSATGQRLENGKLWLDANGHLPLDNDAQEKRPGQELSGVNGNWWVGLSVLHTLFAREHNAIVDRLALDYPNAEGEWLFQKARLVNAALMAKIHTTEWTTALMDSTVGRMAMRGNYWGLMGEHIQKAFGTTSDSEVVSGIPGTETDHHGATFSMTEEFTSIYRMHSLLPDNLEFRSAENDQHITNRSLTEVSFGGARSIYNEAGFNDVLYSLATQNPGALALHNFPETLRKISKKPEEGVWMDLAAVDILRDRERGVPRFNAFRQAIGMPPVGSFEEMTSVKEDQQLLREIYGSTDRVDLQVGCMAEFQSDRQPEGFGFSDTAFRVFILMASRRFKSDRFYTVDFTPEMYTPAGYRWVQDSGFKEVVRRNAPELEDLFADVRNPFYPWSRPIA